MCRPHIFVVLLVLGSAAPLNAQVLLDTVLNRLRPGQTIRVRTRDQGRVEARLLRFQDNALRLEGAGSPDIPVASIDSVWVRGHATATGAIVGGLTLGLTGYIVVNCSDQNDCPSGQGAAGAAVGFGGGALVGALIGAAIPRWKLRYAKKGPSVGLQWNPQRPPALTLTYRF